MKIAIFGAAVLVSALVVVGARADEYVRGYTTKNGTYVQPHYRSSPDSSYNNNWSVSPNTNPYTGQQGTRQPTFNDRPPRSNSLGGGSLYNNYNNGGTRGRRGY